MKEEEFQSEHEEESVQVHRAQNQGLKSTLFLKRMACFRVMFFNYHSYD